MNHGKMEVLFDTSPVLEIDDGGTSYVAGGRILWSEVESISIFNVANQLTIGIRLRNPQAFLDSKNGIQRWLISVNQKLTGAPVNISWTKRRKYSCVFYLFSKNQV